MSTKNHDQKKIFLSFLSLVLITSLAACGGGTNGKATTFTLKGAGAGGDTSAGAKAAYSKNKCINKLQDGDNQSFVDPAGTQSAKICQLSSDPKKRYAINALTRKFIYSKSSAKKGAPVVGITLNVGLDLASAGKITMTDAHKAALVQEITTDCDAEMVSIWRKSGITLKVNYAITPAGADQALVLNSSITSTDQTAQDGTTPSDELVSFDIWPDSKAQLVPANAKACFDKFPDTSTSGGPRDNNAAQRAACVREMNQPFCLALNKLVGNWLGVEDKSDLNCHPTDSIANDPKAKQQSFVTYKMTPDPGAAAGTAVVPPGPVSTPVKPTADTTAASNTDTTSSIGADADPDHAAQMAAFEVESKALLAGIVNTQGTTTTTPVINPVRPATAQPRRRIGQSSDDGTTTTTPVPKDDALYGSYWSPWTVLDSDVSEIFPCATATAATGTAADSTAPGAAPATTTPSTTTPSNAAPTDSTAAPADSTSAPVSMTDKGAAATTGAAATNTAPVADSSTSESTTK